MMVCGMCKKAAYRSATNIATQVWYVSTSWIMEIYVQIKYIYGKLFISQKGGDFKVILCMKIAT